MPATLACIAVATLSGSAGAESFRFWPGKDAAKAPGFIRMSDHPCGEVVVAEVSKLPVPATKALEPDVVVELDSKGRVVLRWPAPVDFTPRALSGKNLLVVAGNVGFWIRPDGRFNKATAIPKSSHEMKKCDLTRVFGKSDYAQCSVLTDQATGKKRTLGYQAVCT